MGQPVLINPSGRMPFFNCFDAYFVRNPSRPFRPGFDILRRWSCFVRVCTEWLDSIYAVIDEVFAAGHCDPGITGSDHVCAGVTGKDKHPQPGYNHRPARKSTRLDSRCWMLDTRFPIPPSQFSFLCFQFLILNSTFYWLSHFCSLSNPLLISSSEQAKLKRILLSQPNGKPGTTATLACSSSAFAKSILPLISAPLIFRP
jgi:hypothetical protein